MNRLMSVALATAIGLMSYQIQADPVSPSFPFRIGERELLMPIPAGYCAAAGAEAAIAQVLAAADKSNTTLATLTACNRNPAVAAFGEYVLVKSPSSALISQLDKASALNELDSAFRSPGAAQITERALAEAERGLGEVLGKKAPLTFKTSYMGRDNDCAYIFGYGFAGENQSKRRGIMVGCMTVAASKLVTVYSYRFTPGSKVADVKAQALAIARSIAPASP